ncbi:MAG: hypothetical protein BAJATHORv1_10015 [Candidatus Thorarchaeota archaeon]|nr:MAG: hypothetical protein BAJATHORv1_10015 [Candidatus Thorarchaeota archaeon]
MNGRNILLILVHLFRKRGKEVNVNEAVEYLSFRWRYGTPSNIRRLLSLALEKDMISREGNIISAKFDFNIQHLSPNQTAVFRDKVMITSTTEEMR